MSFTALATYLERYRWCATHESYRCTEDCMDLDDLDGIATPEEIRHAVLLALKERASIGDKLAEGAVKVIEHLAAGKSDAL